MLDFFVYSLGPTAFDRDEAREISERTESAPLLISDLVLFSGGTGVVAL